MSTQEVIEQFKATMLENDTDPPDTIIADCTGHRFKIGQKWNGFYKLCLDGRPAGVFQNWALHDKPILWKYSGEVQQYTPEEKRAYVEQRRIKAE